MGKIESIWNFEIFESAYEFPPYCQSYRNGEKECTLWFLSPESAQSNARNRFPVKISPDTVSNTVILPMLKPCVSHTPHYIVWWFSSILVRFSFKGWSIKEKLNRTYCQHQPDKCIIMNTVGPVVTNQSSTRDRKSVVSSTWRKWQWIRQRSIWSKIVLEFF